MDRLPALSRQAPPGSCAQTQKEMPVYEAGSQPDAFSIPVRLPVMNSTMSAEQRVQQEGRGPDPPDLPLADLLKSQNTQCSPLEEK